MRCDQDAMVSVGVVLKLKLKLIRKRGAGWIGRRDDSNKIR